MATEQFGKASVQYNDWEGTSALDENDPQHSDLYELAGLDRRDWWIVGVEIYGQSPNSSGRVLAAQRAKYLGSDAPLPDVIEVTAFGLPFGDDFTYLRAFKRWNIHANVRRLEAARLSIIETHQAD